MRRLAHIPLAAILALMLSTSACEKNLHDEQAISQNDHSHEGHGHDSIESYYTCSMHPQVKSDKPGKCPICFMNLTKVEVDKSESSEEIAKAETITHWQCENFPDVTSEVEEQCPIDGTPMIKVKTGPQAGSVIAKIKLQKSQKSHFKPQYFPVTPMKMSRTIRLLGTITQSEEKESSIPARIAGRVEEVMVTSTGSLIQKGDPVLKLYSPKLITAGEEYILARQSVESGKNADFQSLLQKSEERLQLWGISRKQYESWFRLGTVPREIIIYSNVSGVVRKRLAFKGKYFREGANFFELSDLSTVWIEMDVYEHDAALVRLGQSVSLKFTALPGTTMQGQIDFINPVLDSKSRTLKVRATIENTQGQLMPGMVADATLAIAFEGTPLVVPRSAIIDTGERKVAWVKIDEERFQAKLIETGKESEGYVEILSGLEEDQFVVVEGSFLLDAQAQLFGGYEDFKKSVTKEHIH